MAVIQISRIQHRRGLEADLPNLASAELGWSVDTRKLYIGNGTIEEGAPSLGKTEILTQYSILDFETSFASNITILQNNIAVLSSNVTSISNSVANVVAQFTPTTASYLANTSGNVVTFAGNSATVYYTATQGTAVRHGTLSVAHYNSTPVFTDEYNETATTDFQFNITSNLTYANINYTTTSATTLSYTLESF
jgi:hypothetical protein